MPRAHKGWDTLVEGLTHAAAAGWALVAAVDPRSDAVARARERLGARCHVLGVVPRAGIPALLAAVDAAPVLQHDVPFARAQLPAKLLDALAMAVPVVASSVGDLPAILGGGARGWLVPPADPAAVAAALAAIGHDPAGAAARAAGAREWYLREASEAANRERLAVVLSAALAARAARGTRRSGHAG